MADPPAFESALKRDRAITLAGLIALCAASWLYVVNGAGVGMSALEMTRLSLFPHLAATAPAMPEMGGMDMAPPVAPASWSLGFSALMVAMWWVMMIAMMTPSAAPTILLYARAYRHAQAQETRGAAPTGVFAAGYLLVWLGFSVLAALLQWALERGGVVSPLTMGSQSKFLSAAVLAAAGAYQLSPLKHACLSYCRGAAEFLTRHWRPGAMGALRMGLLHGAYCVGCCWALMALLFVGGVMNLAWIGALAMLVLAEKLAPGGVWVSRGAGAVLLIWALATLLVR